jgi:hypothetical protein
VATKTVGMLLRLCIIDIIGIIFRLVFVIFGFNKKISPNSYLTLEIYQLPKALK